MCGGCGARTDVDWAAPFLRSAAARSAAAAVLTAAVPRRVDVRAAPSGWLVRRPTGAQVLVGTLTALVAALGPRTDAVLPLPAVTGAPLPPPDRRRPVALVHGHVPGAVQAGEAGWHERVMTGRGHLVVTTADRPVEVLRELLADPLRRHVRVGALRSPALPGWQAPVRRLPDVPDRVCAAELPALVALLAVRLGGRPAEDRTSTRVAVGQTSVLLDALGPVVLVAAMQPMDPDVEASPSAGDRPVRT